MTTRSRQTFKQIVTLPDLAIPLAEAALLLACEEYPQLSFGPYLEFLDTAAGRVREVTGGRVSARSTIQALNSILFDEYGFSGNETDYYDPRNSFLNDVIDRRTGIPITLSAVYMAVAERIGFNIDGIGLPGHFIVRHRVGEEDFFLDPYNKGMRLTPELLREMTSAAGAGSDPEPWLTRSTHREILLRMLDNLRMIYLKRHAFDKVISMLNLMVIAEPEAHDLYRQRGLLHLQTGQFEAAAGDLRRYLRNQKDQDATRVQEALGALGRIRAMLN